MNVYFFSEHTTDPNMIKDLGTPITAQFKGTISDIHRRSNQIAFIEDQIIWGHKIEICHTIPAESIVVVDGTILLQDAWLKAGIATLLIPQMKHEKGKWGSILLKYCGLLQIHRIEVGISQWTSTDPTRGEKVKEQMTLITK